MIKLDYKDYRHGNAFAYEVFSAILGKRVTAENMTYSDINRAVGCISVGDKALSDMEEVNPYDLESTVNVVARLFAKNAMGEGEIVTAATFGTNAAAYSGEKGTVDYAMAEQFSENTHGDAVPFYDGIIVNYSGMEPERVEEPKPLNAFKRFINSIFPSAFAKEKKRIEDEQARYDDYNKRMKHYYEIEDKSSVYAQKTSDRVWARNTRRMTELNTNSISTLTEDEIANDKIVENMRAAKSASKESISFAMLNGAREEKLTERYDLSDSKSLEGSYEADAESEYDDFSL